MILTLDRYITADGKHPGFMEEFKLHPEYFPNAKVLTARVSELLDFLGIKDYQVSSGFRPLSYNKAIGGATNSLHTICHAIDLLDPQKQIGKKCMQNLEALHERGLHMESLIGREGFPGTHNTPGKEPWLHIQDQPPHSGAIVFLPK